MLWALGQRLASEGIHTPFESIQPTHTYDSLEDARQAIQDVGSRIASDGLAPDISPLVVGIAGYGNVAGGVREILAELPTRDIDPAEIGSVVADGSSHAVIQTTFREEHLVEPVNSSHVFGMQDYYDHPDAYRGAFARYLPHLSVLVNCIYWDDRYPRLVSKEDLRTLHTYGGRQRLRVIADLGCDIEGAVECTKKTTDPSNPVYVWDPATDTIERGVDGDGPVVLAVDILPSELPREASDEFSRALAPFLPALATADFDAPFDQLQLPEEILGAVIVHRGKLTPQFSYLADHIGT
jgi:alpha-aminoadipic semialdehyde synthase